MLDVNVMGGERDEVAENLMRLRTPEICGVKDGSVKLKLTCHWLSV